MYVIVIVYYDEKYKIHYNNDKEDLPHEERTGETGDDK